MEGNNTIIIFLFCIIGIIIFGKIFITPIKKIMKLVVNSLLGGILIVIINYIGGTFNFHIGLNIITAIFVRNTWDTRSYIFSSFKNILLKNVSKNSIIKNITSKRRIIWKD